jgi:hypothetical protein
VIGPLRVVVVAVFFFVFFRRPPYGEARNEIFRSYSGVPGTTMHSNWPNKQDRICIFSGVVVA